MATETCQQSECVTSYVSEGEESLDTDDGEREELSINLDTYDAKSSLTHIFNVEELLSFKCRWFSQQLKTAQRIMMYFRNGFFVVLQKEREHRFPSIQFHHAFPPCEFYVFTLRKILV